MSTAGPPAATNRPTIAGHCPSCGEPFDAEQEYCLECGLRLPWESPVFAKLTAQTARRTRFLPGDWVWPGLFTALVAAAGAAVAIAVTREDTDGSAEAIAVATGGNPPADTQPATLPAPPEPTAGSRTSTGPPPRTRTRVAAGRPGLVRWPRGRDGWTIVLVSLPQSGGGARARETARAALDRGLREVGILDSNRWASLHPGYYVVFTGIYASPEEAVGGLQRAKAAYPLAYTREIAS